MVNRVRRLNLRIDPRFHNLEHEEVVLRDQPRIDLCSAITRSRQRGRRQIFVMQAAQHRSDAHREALADPMAG
jgi:hypothetical protein